VRIVAYNLDTAPVQATMTGWNVDPGTWTMTHGTRPGDTEAPLNHVTERRVELERTGSLDVMFEPRTFTVIELTRVSKGMPYWTRPDLGMSESDVHVEGRRMTVTVHSVGATDAPANLPNSPKSCRYLQKAAGIMEEDAEMVLQRQVPWHRTSVRTHSTVA
jgi:hypothetical protein